MVSIRGEKNCVLIGTDTRAAAYRIGTAYSKKVCDTPEWCLGLGLGLDDMYLKIRRSDYEEIKDLVPAAAAVAFQDGDRECRDEWNDLFLPMVFKDDYVLAAIGDAETHCRKRAFIKALMHQIGTLPWLFIRHKEKADDLEQDQDQEAD